MVFLRLALLFEDGIHAISRSIRVLCLVPMSRQCLRSHEWAMPRSHGVENGARHGLYVLALFDTMSKI